MLSFPQRVLSSFTVVDVTDPADMDSDSRVSRRFPSGNDRHTYVLRDRILRRQPPQDLLLTRLAMRPAGDLMPTYVGDRYGTEVSIIGMGVNRFCLTTMLHGQMEMFDGRTAAETTAQGNSGLVYLGEPGARFTTSDDNTRFNTWVAADRVEKALSGLLGAPLGQPLVFLPAVDWSCGLAATLQSLLRLLASEMEREDGLISNPAALLSFTDLLVQTMLHGLPHSHSARLAGGKSDLVPRHLRRAEEYMRSYASQPVSLQDVADVAGCSLRSLHHAFRRWRDTTPLAALHQIRLDRVRADLCRIRIEATPQSVMAIARQYGFTNRTRFLAAYASRFGELPPGTRAAKRTD